MIDRSGCFGFILLCLIISASLNAGRLSWQDVDKDCQNTRHELLIEESLVTPTFKTVRKCQVIAGLWVDVYVDATYTLASQVDVDHVVPWFIIRQTNPSPDAYNDLSNLVITGKRVNQSKSNKAPGQWMPPKKSAHAWYLGRWFGH